MRKICIIYKRGAKTFDIYKLFTRSYCYKLQLLEHNCIRVHTYKLHQITTKCIREFVYTNLSLIVLSQIR